MHKKYVLLLCCLITVSAISAQDYCAEIIEQIYQAYKVDNDLTKALERLQDAETCDFKDQFLKSRQQAQANLFEAIQAQKERAEQAEEDARRNQRTAEQRAREAKSAELAAKAQVLNRTDPTVALNLALAAYATEPTQQAVDALAAILGERRTVFYHDRDVFPAEDFASPGLEMTKNFRIEEPLFFGSPDGAVLAFSFPNDKVTRLVRRQEKRKLFDLDQKYANGEILFSPNGSFLITQKKGNPLTVWSLKQGSEGEIIKSWTGEDAITYGLSRLGSNLVLIGRNSVKIWQTDTGKEGSVITIPFDEAWTRKLDKASIDEGGTRIMGITFDSLSLFIWTVIGTDSLSLLGTGPLKKDYKESIPIKSATFLSKRGRYFSIGRNKEVFSAILGPNYHEPRETLGPLFPEPDANQRDIFTITGTSMKSSDLPQPEVVSTAISADGNQLLTFARQLFFEPYIKVWNLDETEEWFSLKGLKGVTYSAAYDPNQTSITTLASLVALAKDEDSLYMRPEIIKWDTRPWHDAEEVMTLKEIKEKKVQFSPDGRSVAFLNGSNQPMVQDLLPPPGSESVNTSSLKASLPGRMVYYDEQQKELMVYQFSNSKDTTSKVLKGLPKSVNITAVTSKGSYVAAAVVGVLYIWNVNSSNPPKIIQAHEKNISVLSFSPDGRKLYTSAWKEPIKIWEVSSGNYQGAWKDPFPEDSVKKIVISPNNRRIAVSSDEGEVKLWSPGIQGDTLFWNKMNNGFNSFRQYAAYQSLDPPKEWIDEMSVEIRDIRFSPDGQYLLLASEDWDNSTYLLRMWHLGTGNRSKTAIFTLFGKADFQAIQFSSDGSSLLSVDVDGNVQRWRNPILGLKNGTIYRLKPAAQKAYGIEVNNY